MPTSGSSFDHAGPNLSVIAQWLLTLLHTNIWVSDKNLKACNYA